MDRQVRSRSRSATSRPARSPAPGRATTSSSTLPPGSLPPTPSTTSRVRAAQRRLPPGKTDRPGVACCRSRPPRRLRRRPLPRARAPPPLPPRSPPNSRSPVPPVGTVGWSADGPTPFVFITPSARGPPTRSGADGTGLKTIASGVRLASIAPAGSSLAYATAEAAPSSTLAAPDRIGSPGRRPGVRWARSAGRGESRRMHLRASRAAAGATTGEAPHLPRAALCVFSPDGSKLLC